MSKDFIRQSGTTDDVDKIAFVRSRLVLGSKALKMMKSVPFVARNVGLDYELFKEKMLQIFGGRAETTVTKQIRAIVEGIESGGTLGHFHSCW